MADNRKKPPAAPPSIEPPGQSFPDFRSLVNEARTVEHEALPTVRRQLEYSGGESQVGAEDDEFAQVSFFEAQVMARRVDAAVVRGGGISISLPKIQIGAGGKAEALPRSEEEIELSEFAHGQEEGAQIPKPSSISVSGKVQKGGLLGMFSLPFGKKAAKPSISAPQSIMQTPPPEVPEPSQRQTHSLPESQNSPETIPPSAAYGQSQPQQSSQEIPPKTYGQSQPQQSAPKTPYGQGTGRQYSSAIPPMPAPSVKQPPTPSYGQAASKNAPPPIPSYGAPQAQPTIPSVPSIEAQPVSSEDGEKPEIQKTGPPLREAKKKPGIPAMPTMHHDAPLIRPISTFGDEQENERTSKPEAEPLPADSGEPDDEGEPHGEGGSDDEGESDGDGKKEMDLADVFGEKSKEKDENKTEEATDVVGVVYKHGGGEAALSSKSAAKKLILPKRGKIAVPIEVREEPAPPANGRKGKKSAPAEKAIAGKAIAGKAAIGGKAPAVKAAIGGKSKAGKGAKSALVEIPGKGAKAKGGKKSKAESNPAEISQQGGLSHEGELPQESEAAQEPEIPEEPVSAQDEIAPTTKSGRLIRKLRSMQSIAPKLKSALSAPKSKAGATQPDAAASAKKGAAPAKPKKGAMPTEDEIRKIEEKASLYPPQKYATEEKITAITPEASKDLESEMLQATNSEAGQKEAPEPAEQKPPARQMEKMPVSSKRVFPHAPSRHSAEAEIPSENENDEKSGDDDSGGGSGGAPLPPRAHPTFKGSRMFPGRREEGQAQSETPAAESAGALAERVRAKAKSIFPREMAQVASVKIPPPRPEEKITLGAMPADEGEEKGKGDEGEQGIMPSVLPEERAPPEKPEAKEFLPPQIREKAQQPPPQKASGIGLPAKQEETQSAATPSVASQISTSAAPVLGVTPPSAEKVQGAAVLTDEIYFAYARERAKWIYEIYKIGGMTLDEFRSQIREKMAQDAGKSQDGAGAPANPAFQNLNKELDRKFKK